MQHFGKIETEYADNKFKVDQYAIRTEEEKEKQDVERRTEANKFLEQLLGNMNTQDQEQGQQMPEQTEAQMSQQLMG